MKYTKEQLQAIAFLNEYTELCKKYHCKIWDSEENLLEIDYGLIDCLEKE